MKVLNLTLHRADDDQLKAGVEDLTSDVYKDLRDLALVEENPSKEEIDRRARKIARIASDYCDDRGLPRKCMIGGAPWFVPHLLKVLRASRFRVFFAFSRRRSAEERDPETGVTYKAGTFKHLGFVESP